MGKKLYLILGIVVFVVLAIFLIPWGYHKEYVLDMNNLDENNCSGNICITSWHGKLPVLNGKAEISFKEPIDLSTVDTTLYINATGNQSIYVDNKLFWNPIWNDYKLVKSFNQTMVYVSPSYSNKSFEDAGNIDDWLKKNAKGNTIYGLNVNITNPVNDNVGFKEGEFTEINTTLRGTHQFYVYLKNEFNITMGKNDINGYDGKDEFNVSLIQADKTIYSELFKDDDNGNKTEWNGKDPVQVKNFYSKVNEGVYLLKLENLKNGNRHLDGCIKNIKINTNKIVAFGHLILVQKVSLYTENPSENEIKLNYWYKNKDQEIIVTGDENKIINLTKKDKYKIVYSTLKGKTMLYFPKGDVQIWAGGYFAFNESNYFEPFYYNLKTNNPNFLISNKNLREINKNKFEIRSKDMEINKIFINFDNNFRRVNYFYILGLLIIIFFFLPFKKNKRGLKQFNKDVKLK